MWERFSNARTRADKIKILSDYLYDAWVNGNTEYSPNWRINQEIAKFIGANYKEIGVHLETHTWDHSDEKAATSPMMKGFREAQPFWQRALRLSWRIFTPLIGLSIMGWFMYVIFTPISALPFSMGVGFIVVGVVCTTASLLIGTTVTLLKSGFQSQNQGQRSARNSNVSWNFSFVRFVQGAALLGGAAILISIWGPLGGPFALFMIWGADFTVVGLILTGLRAVGITNTRHFGTFFTATICGIGGLFGGARDGSTLALILLVVGLVAGGILGSIAGEMAYNCVNNSSAAPPRRSRRR